MERENAVQFQMELAGLSFSVQCGFESTRALCADYLTEDSGAPDLSIAVTREDLEWERQRLLRKNDPQAYAPLEALESLSLNRKIAEYLPGRDRVLFHGSCLAFDGQGVLFTAKSGTGKSTHTRLWREVFGDRVVMVNDDKPFLHIREDGVSVCGTPWRGKHRLGSNLTVPLKAVCIVTRDCGNRIERITPRDALTALLQQTYRPADPEMLGQTLTLLDVLSRQVGLYRLYCNMDPQAAQVALTGMDVLQK